MIRNFYKIENGKIKNINSQITGVLSNGKTVSGYNSLPDEILAAEGWKPLTAEEMPEIIEGVDITYESCFEETETEIRQKYRIVIPEEQSES